MIENLNLAHGVVSGINTHRSADSDTIIDTLAEEAELETIDEVAVFLLRVEVAGAALVGTHIDGSVDRNITFKVSLPFVKVGSVEEHLKALLLLLSSEL